LQKRIDRRRTLSCHHKHNQEKVGGMNIPQLENVVLAAREGGIRRAAERAHLDFTALSRQVTCFEQEHRVQAFERSPRGLRPTPAGNLLLGDARMIIDGLQRLRAAAIGARRSGEQGALRVGLYPMALTILGLRAMPTSISGRGIEYFTTTPGPLVQMTAAGLLDIALIGVRPDSAPPGTRLVPLARTELHVVCSRQSAFARSTCLALRELAGQNLILPSAGEFPAKYAFLRALISEQGLESNPVEVLDFFPGQALVQTAFGRGVSILPREYALPEHRYCRCIPLKQSIAVDFHALVRTDAPDVGPAIDGFLRTVNRLG
jgi:DNA-binding transcriptional LysR family regulator